MLRKCPLTYLYPEVCEKHPGKDGGDEQEQGMDAEVDGGVDVPVGAVVREHPVGTAVRLQVTSSSWKPGNEWMNECLTTHQNKNKIGYWCQTNGIYIKKLKSDTRKWMNEWMIEWMNEWMNEWIN